VHRSPTAEGNDARERAVAAAEKESLARSLARLMSGVTRASSSALAISTWHLITLFKQAGSSGSASPPI
jgi:hypothetical protein